MKKQIGASLLVVWFQIFGMIAVAQEFTLEERALMAVRSSNFDALVTLASEGLNYPDVKVNGNSLMFEAAVFGDSSILSFLEKKGVQINAKDAMGYTPIMRALSVGNLENAEVLEALGASLKGITKDGFTVRVLAEQVGLENYGPEYDSQVPLLITQEEANNLLLLAAEAGDWKAAEYAITNGASLKSRADNGWTPLMLAGMGNHSTFFVKLLRKLNGMQLSEIAPKIGGIDVIHTILLGKAIGRNSDALRMLNSLRDIQPSLFEDEGGELRKLAIREGFSLEVQRLFPVPRMLPVDTKMPRLLSPSPENWKKVQNILVTEGLYNGTIDGKPGKGTKRALFAYFEPLAHEFRKRCLSMTRNFNWTYSKGAKIPNGFRIIHRQSSGGIHRFVEYTKKGNRGKIDGYNLTIYSKSSQMNCQYQDQEHKEYEYFDVRCNEDHKHSSYVACGFKILSREFKIIMSNGRYTYNLGEFGKPNRIVEISEFPVPDIVFPERFKE